MEGDERTPKGIGAPLLAFCFIAALLIMYVMSIGPVVYVYRVTGEKPSVADVIDVFYAPVEWAYSYTPVRGPIRWYLELWK